jgi:DNA-binding transcriptional ArsR family regulator
MVTVVFRETSVIQDKSRSVAMLLEFKSDNRIDARLPIANPPSLDDSLVLQQFKISADNHTSETRERAADFSAYFCRRAAGELAKLFRVCKRIVKALWACFEHDLLMDVSGHFLFLLFCCCNIKPFGLTSLGHLFAVLSTEMNKKLSDDRLDLVFHAISDRTRRALLARLTNGPVMVTELAKPFAMSLPGVAKHIRVLERARLVSRTVDGRIHRCSLAPGPLQEAERWLSHYRSFWMDTLDSLARYAEKEKQGKSH